MLAALLAAALALGPATESHAGSTYVALDADRIVDANVALLRADVSLPRPKSVLVKSDGSYAPLGPASAARIVIEVDGRLASNGSVLDWRGSLGPQEHSFDVVGA